jgi:hypothetical protein
VPFVFVSQKNLFSDYFCAVHAETERNENEEKFANVRGTSKKLFSKSKLFVHSSFLCKYSTDSLGADYFDEIFHADGLF